VDGYFDQRVDDGLVDDLAARGVFWPGKLLG
jgi:hypothetical protein